MPRPGRLFVLCLLLLLLPLRSVLAAGQRVCEPVTPPAVQAQQACDEHASPQDGSPEPAQATKACKLCAPCCLAAAPPPMLMLDANAPAPAARVASAPAEPWVGIVPPLPDPPPRA